MPNVEEGLREVWGVEHGEEDGEDHHQDLCQQRPHDPRSDAATKDHLVQTTF